MRNFLRALVESESFLRALVESPKEFLRTFLQLLSILGTLFIPQSVCFKK